MKTFLFLKYFSRKGRSDIREGLELLEQTRRQAAIAAEKAQIAARDEVKSFTDWLEKAISDTDYKTNYVAVGKECILRWNVLLQRVPELAAHMGGYGWSTDIDISEASYSWLDDEYSWHNWDYDKMQSHYQDVLTSIKEHQWLSEDYSLDRIEFNGGTEPYMAVAYLSYAKLTKDLCRTVLSRLKKLAPPTLTHA